MSLPSARVDNRASENGTELKPGQKRNITQAKTHF